MRLCRQKNIHCLSRGKAKHLTHLMHIANKQFILLQTTIKGASINANFARNSFLGGATLDDLAIELVEVDMVHSFAPPFLFLAVAFLLLVVLIVPHIVAPVKNKVANLPTIFVANLRHRCYTTDGGVLMTTGELIRNRRKELGMTADVLAETIGVSRSTVFRYENGFIEKIPISNLVPIARALHTTVGYLMGWDEENNAPATGAGNECESEAMQLFDNLSEHRKVEALNYLRYLAISGDNQ